MMGFIWRWPELSERKPQHLAANRAFSLTECAVSAWISKVSANVTDAGLGDRLQRNGACCLQFTYIVFDSTCDLCNLRKNIFSFKMRIDITSFFNDWEALE